VNFFTYWSRSAKSSTASFSLLLDDRPNATASTRVPLACRYRTAST